MLPGSPASCRPAGSRRCASRTSRATRSGRSWRAGRCWSRSSVTSRTRSVAFSRTSVSSLWPCVKFNVFAVRAEELIENRPELIAAVGPLLAARKAIEQQVGDLDRKVHKLARHDVQVRRFMTVPGVGPITALCFKATIDDPTRFKRSRSVGALRRIDDPTPCFRGDGLVRAEISKRGGTPCCACICLKRRACC